MKVKLLGLLILILSVFTHTACDTDAEALDIQKLKTYDDQYYANLRAYKKTDHVISFGWYAAYAPIEGVDGFKDPASWGERIIGLPDSLDICSLWMGIPSNNPADPGYAPVAYADMKFVQSVRGTRFVAPTIVRMNKVITLRDGTQYDLRDHHDDEGIAVFGQYLVDQVLDNDLDGLDLDFEPEGDWMDGDNFVKLVKYIGQYFGPGPGAKYPEKLLCVDFYGHYPTSGVEPYVNYFIRQSYAASSAATLQSQYNSISWAPASKFIVTETLGAYYANGGVAFTEADGNTITNDPARKGDIMYSLEGMARWNPTQGRKGGFGAFYFDRDYYSARGPYYNFRYAIQAANPAIK